MKLAILTSLLAALAIVFTACAPKEDEKTLSKDSFPLLPKDKRAESFDAVAGKLDLGGEVFSFMDFGDTMKRMGDIISSFVQDMQRMQPNDQSLAMAAHVPYDALFTTLGLDNFTAMGVSSYREGTLYHSKQVLYLPGGPEGFFQLTGSENLPFESLALAPKDTDIFLAQTLQLSVIDQIIRQGAEDIFKGKQGRDMANKLLGEEVSNGVTLSELLQKSDTRLTLVIRLDEGSSMPVPGMATPLSIPEFKTVICLEGMAWLITDDIIEIKENTREDEVDGLLVYTPRTPPPPGGPMGDLDPAIIIDPKTNNLYLTTHLEFLHECTSTKTSLKDKPGYKTATADLPTSGTSLIYISKDAFNTFVDVRDEVKQSMPMGGALGMYELMLPILGIGDQSEDSAFVTTVGPDFIFSEGRLPVTADATMNSNSAVVVTGLLAAMAIPAFNKVREDSREKAITNNLRQIASAGQQYILETGDTKVGYKQLEGEYFYNIQPVAGESYEDLVVSEDGGTLTVTTASGDEISYTY